MKSARLAQHLHYLSFTSAHFHEEGAIIADYSDPCLKLVVKVAFAPGNPFMFDDLCRREDGAGIEE